MTEGPAAPPADAPAPADPPDGCDVPIENATSDDELKQLTEPYEDDQHVSG